MSYIRDMNSIILVKITYIPMFFCDRWVMANGCRFHGN